MDARGHDQRHARAAQHCQITDQATFIEREWRATLEMNGWRDERA
jgi:hypothetical protein